MDLAPGKIELSERYIQKLKCGHTLQSYNAVVLWRNNGIQTPSVTAVIVLHYVLHFNFKFKGHLTFVLSESEKNVDNHLTDQ